LLALDAQGAHKIAWDLNDHFSSLSAGGRSAYGADGIRLGVDGVDPSHHDFVGSSTERTPEANPRTSLGIVASEAIWLSRVPAAADADPSIPIGTLKPIRRHSSFR